MKRLIPLTAVKKGAVFCMSPSKELVVHCKSKRERFVYAVNLANTTLYRHVDELCLLDEQLIQTLYVLYKYIMRIGDSRELRKLTYLPKNVLSELRDSVFSSSSMLLFKLATLKCVFNKLEPNKQLHRVREIFEEYGLTRDDAILYVLMFHNDDIDILVKNLAEVKDGFELTVDSLRKEISTPDAQKKLNSFARYFCYKRIRFLYTGNRLTLDDVAHDVIMRAVQAYYWVRPFYPKTHALNYAIRSMNKQTLNLIRYYNDPSRARVVQEGEAFTNTIVDITNSTISDGFTEDAIITYIDYKNQGRVYAQTHC